MRALVLTAPPRAATSGALADWAPGLIVIGAVLFNAALAFVNGNVAGLTQAPVVAAEVLFVAAAHVIALRNYKAQMAPWYALLGLFIAFALLRSLYNQAIDVKYLRDVMIIPTFVVLGMTFEAKRLSRIVVAIQIVMLMFLIVEAINTDLYANIFKIMDYYINTRGYSADDFWNKDSTLFVSATRPDDRFFSLIDLHRLSSIFLEPVSLGNYCMIVVAYLCACYRELGRPTRWFLVGSTVMATVGCDGRLAIASTLPMIVCCFLAPRLPRDSALLYIPGVIVLAFVMVGIGHFEPGGDDFPGRIAHTVYLLSNYGVAEFAGLSDAFLSKAVDSGIAYLITTQSLLVVIALWATIVVSARNDRPDQARYTHAVCIYISLNMMVSFALLTIKTAALMWFVFGSLQARRKGSAEAAADTAAALGASRERVRDLVRPAPAFVGGPRRQGFEPAAPAHRGSPRFQGLQFS